MEVNILWTGGLDSTYRVIELTRLLQEGDTIQPYYIIDKQRKSTPKELHAIEIITKKINIRSDKIKVKDLKTIFKEEIAQNPEITKSYFKFNSSYNLGGQYEWLARFAHQYDIMLEVGLELLPNSRTLNTIEGEGALMDCGKEAYSCYQINKNCSSIDLIRVFGNFLFPKTMRGKSKNEEIQALRCWGFEDVIMDTWFCHRPVLGKPCGLCNPCKDCIEMGLGWRVPYSGRILGYLRLPQVYIGKMFSKILKI